MTVAVRHATQTALPDSGDGKVSSNAWNEAHAEIAQADDDDDEDTLLLLYA